LKEADIVFVTSSETGYMEQAVKLAYSYDKEIVLDVGSYGVTPEYLRKVVPKVDVLLGNESELTQVLNAFGIKRIEDILQIDLYKPDSVVSEDKIAGKMKLFQRNCVPKTIGPVPINKIGSSVGACDGMATGILSALQRDLPLTTACRVGLLEASSIWEVEGVQEGMLRTADLLSRYVKAFGGTELDVVQEKY
jgi:adenosine kinase